MSLNANLDFKALLSLRKCYKGFWSFHLGYCNSVPQQCFLSLGYREAKLNLVAKHKNTFRIKHFVASAALQGSPPVPPVYLFRLGFGAGLNHWNSRFQPQTFHISVIIRGCVASWQKLVFYGQLHRWEQVWHCRLGTEGTKEHSGSEVPKAGQWLTNSSSTALDCSFKKTWGITFLLGLEGLAVTGKR